MDDDSPVTPRGQRTGRTTRKTKVTAQRGLSKPGGIRLRCDCRWTRTGGAWRHLTPCRTHELHLVPAGDLEMRFLASGEAA